MSIGRPCEFDGSPALYMDVQTTSEDAPFVRAIIDATVAAHLPTSGDPVPAWIEQHLVDQVAQAAQQRATTEAEQVALQEAHRAAVLSADLGAGVSPAQLANALTARSMRGCMP
ncbi:hypothetical protein [Gordonia sp. (in: high G+C Gram-positive bacteria)]|uniref:hypothetical protein n=1 Tax=Gordonia sp. (in: high G+C Gram-positive bacteria) TaxID=84139 RepID=UPI003BB5B1AF